MARPVVDALDQFVDTAMAPLRGRPWADAAAYGASAVGDHGLVWLLIGVARGRPAGPRRAVAIRAVVFTGAVAPVVNAALKSAIGRVRPDGDTTHRLPLRIPNTASFPSGHALAAWCAAILLAEGDRLAPAYYALALAVSVSRVHVSLHHATDVVAGSLLGVALARVGRRLVPAGGPWMRRLECTTAGRG